MSLPSVLCGASERSGLPLLLVVSLLIHLSLICFFSPPKSGGGGLAEGAALPSLRAALSRAVRAVPVVAPEPLVQERAPAPVREQARSAELLADDEPGSNLPPGPAFYEARALTIKPVALGDPLLDAWDVVSGEVVLALWIDDRGAVVKVSIERSDLPADRLAAVTDAFRLLRFAPGELNGRKVGALMRIAVSYDDERLLIEP